MTAKIKQFNRTTLDLLRVELNEALKVVSEKFGVQAGVGNCRYDKQSATFKVELAVTNSTGIAQTKIVGEFLAVAEQLDLSKGDLYKEFSYLGETYKLIGYSRRSRTYPFIAERVRDGGKIKFSKEVIFSCFKAINTAKLD